MAELKPCPFCGENPCVQVIWGNLCRVFCDAADHSAETCWHDSKEEAIEAWNRRAEDGKQNAAD